MSSYNEKKQLSLGFNGDIEIKKSASIEFQTITALKGGLNNVNIYGRILRKFPIKEFNNEQKNGKLCNFQFGDSTDILRATAWNEKVDEILNFEEGEAIEIKNAYTKNGMFGIELHIGYNTILTKSQKEIVSATNIFKENTPRKTLNQLTQNQTVIINAKIKEIQLGNLFYLACEKCNKKIVQNTSGSICEKCGEVVGKKNPVLNIIVEDQTASIRANLFGETALELINKTQTEFEENLNNKSIESNIEELNQNLVGKTVEFFGYLKTNSYSQDDEFNVNEIIN